MLISVTEVDGATMMRKGSMQQAFVVLNEDVLKKMHADFGDLRNPSTRLVWCGWTRPPFGAVGMSL